MKTKYCLGLVFATRNNAPVSILKRGVIMYLVSVFEKAAFYGYPPIYEGYFDNPEKAEKAAIDICLEGGFAPWTVTIDCIKCVCS